MLNPDPMDWIYKPLNERAAEIIKAIVANLVYNIDVIPPLSKFILDGVIAIAIMNRRLWLPASTLGWASRLECGGADGGHDVRRG